MNRKTMRRRVYKRDRGVCVNCRLNTEKIHRRVTALPPQARMVAMMLLESKGFNRGDISILWEADHILALDEGGKDVLDNLQTLCIPCHKEKSGEQSVRGARRRRLIGKKRIPNDELC